jgi:hypothetical protein
MPTARSRALRCSVSNRHCLEKQNNFLNCNSLTVNILKSNKRQKVEIYVLSVSKGAELSVGYIYSESSS